VAAAKARGATNSGASVAADLVELGYLRGAYGLRGWAHVHPYSGDGAVLRQTSVWWLLPPSAAIRAPSAAAPVQVTGVRVHGGALVAKWHGCEDPQTAQALRGWRVAVPRGAFPPLPDGQYYWVDLVGALVVNRSAQPLGVVRGLRSNGAQDLLEVQPAEVADAASNPILIPMVAAYVDAVDLAARRIHVDWEPQW